MRTRLVYRFGAHAFGTFGLLLVLLVCKLARYEVTPRNTYPRRARAWLTRRAIDGIGAIGWLVDRLPAPVSKRKSELNLAGERIDTRTA